MSATDDEVEQLLRRTRAARERCNNRMALIGNCQINFKGFLGGFSYFTGFHIIHTLITSIILYFRRKWSSN